MSIKDTFKLVLSDFLIYIDHVIRISDWFYINMTKYLMTFKNNFFLIPVYILNWIRPNTIYKTTFHSSSESWFPTVLKISHSVIYQAVIFSELIHSFHWLPMILCNFTKKNKINDTLKIKFNRFLVFVLLFKAILSNMKSFS